MHHVQYDLLYQNSGGSRRGARAPLILDQTEARRAKKIFFWRPAFPQPPLPPLSQGLDPAMQNTGTVYAHREAKY